jgi:branched-chain amino acid transport system ATP-binding protein
MDAASPCLVLDGVSRHFGGLMAVDGVDLMLRPGERHALIGPNGAGKTTLFNVISGEVRATAGTVRLNGVDVTGLKPHERAARGIARTFQITKLFPNLTVLENMLIACEALDRRKFTMHRPLASCTDLIERATAVLDECHLPRLGHRLARHLSYGDQRKLEVALSMATRPRVLLLDEPMAGLSAAERDVMQALLHNLNPSIAVLLIEHDIDVAFAFAERVTVLFHGRVLTEGPTAVVSANRRVQEIYLGLPAEKGA